MLDPLLADTAPAAIEINARLKRHVTRMTAQLEDLDKQNQTTPSPATPRPRTAPAPPPPARAQKEHLPHPHPPPLSRECASKRRCRTREEVAESGEILPRYGEFPRFAMHVKTVLETQAAAKWAFRLFTVHLDAASAAPNTKHWLIHDWYIVRQWTRKRSVD